MENIEKCELWQGDCLELMKELPSGSVDLIAKQRIDEAIKGGANG